MTLAFQLPPEDRESSPYTGYTRAHWEAVADGLLASAWRWSTPGGALLDLPGRPSAAGVRSDGLEGFARTFLAAAFRVAGAGGGDPHGWLERYASGLASGTRTPGRDDTESWPLILDHLVAGQPMVESASIALGLRLTAPWLWKNLDAGVQDRTEEWLRGALRHTPAPNNWYLFPHTVAGFLESVGRGDAETAAVRQRARELLEGWYVGDGWYSDGDGRAFDHYNGWALHLYPVLDAHLAAADAEAYGTRLREHLEGFGLMFAADGAPLYYGRSLTYRFAASAAVGLGAVTGHTPLSPGASRRLISGSLRHFLDRGALTEDGLLHLGWYGPHKASLQTYSGPSSPYWASKAFVALLAPPGHPLWTDPEEPAPVETADRVLALPAPGLLIQSTRADGIVRLHNHGSDHVRPHDGETATDDPLYGRQAYSTRTGPTASGNIADNHLSVEVGGRGSVRRRIHPLGAGGGDGWGWAASWHRPVFTAGPPMVPGLRVESVTVARGPYELRVHRVIGAPTDSRVTHTGWATGPDDSVVSALHALHGWDEGSELLRAPQGTAHARWAQVPRLAGQAGGTTVHVSLAALTAEPLPLEEAVTELVVEHGRVQVIWALDGARSVIGFGPMAVSLLD
ncbi:DUF2264 domain-containing protein [Streptomyces aurantiogriseus]|uniref:DUF2264 domain-containing protein n=1 Tax=Streptomyces aurantiogriseus TaxID=66870 RepID=A0A918FKP8_9ACTN|nr:DUF2264 domain-containing protein [Streptomyces aurantiogriseus]GGR47466.1 hypothetical protein GCM10010251_75630 [Streptomyces aurantiogriseus]